MFKYRLLEYYLMVTTTIFKVPSPKLFGKNYDQSKVKHKILLKKYYLFKY